MGEVVNSTKRDFGMKSSNEFFKPHDLFRGRVYEEWELEVIFNLNQGEASPLIDSMGNMDSRTISVGDLFQCLSLFVENLN